LDRHNDKLTHAFEKGEYTVKRLHHLSYTAQRGGEQIRDDDPTEYTYVAARYDPVYQHIRQALQRWDLKNIAKDTPDAYERETVLLLKHLPTLRHVKEARSLVYELFADHDMSPDVAATQAVNLDLLADEVWHLWKRHQEIKEFLLKAHSRARGLFLRFAHPVTNNR
jgi:hypothetical protein